MSTGSASAWSSRPLRSSCSPAGSGVVASRYYLPPLTLLAVAGARALATFRAEVIVAVSAVVIGAGLWQLHDARGWVKWWVDVERQQESLVREAAARAAGGCTVEVTGSNVELVSALPVLMPLANEPARLCAPGERFVVVIDWFAGETGETIPCSRPCSRSDARLGHQRREDRSVQTAVAERSANQEDGSCAHEGQAGDPHRCQRLPEHDRCSDRDRCVRDARKEREYRENLEPPEREQERAEAAA